MPLKFSFGVTYARRLYPASYQHQYILGQPVEGYPVCVPISGYVKPAQIGCAEIYSEMARLLQAWRVMNMKTMLVVMTAVLMFRMPVMLNTSAV